MVRMPVATLRVWERRYRVAAPATTGSGHRLYSAQQVQRLALLKQLTDLGHAIGAIAALNMAQLQQVAQTHARSLQTAQSVQSAQAAVGLAVVAANHTAAPTGSGAASVNARRLAVVAIGATLGSRLARPAFAQSPGAALRVVASNAGSLLVAPSKQLVPARTRAGAVLVHVAGLPLSAVATLCRGIQVLATQVGATQTVVIYSHMSAPAQQALAAHGVLLCQDTPQDAVLAERLASLLGGPKAAFAPKPAAPLSQHLQHLNLPARVAARRYNDATLADLAGLSSTIACECPQHVAGLLMQLSHFEDYSAQCQAQGGSTQDIALHDYLWRVAGTARALFEDALERVAVQEGLMLQPQAAPQRAARKRDRAPTEAPKMAKAVKPAKARKSVTAVKAVKAAKAAKAVRR
jgi:MerR family transcriptional regulator, light-induced transcriptional regulator